MYKGVGRTEYIHSRKVEYALQVDCKGGGTLYMTPQCVEICGISADPVMLACFSSRCISGMKGRIPIQCIIMFFKPPCDREISIFAEFMITQEQ